VRSVLAARTIALCAGGKLHCSAIGVGSGSRWRDCCTSGASPSMLILSAIVALATVIYLVVAIVRPERF
jgi:K+-transporting ATPase KdpF subunit